MGVNNVIGTVANRVKPQRSSVDEDYFFVAGNVLKPAAASESDADRSLNA
jgi:hypothetical protein